MTIFMYIYGWLTVAMVTITHTAMLSPQVWQKYDECDLMVENS